MVRSIIFLGWIVVTTGLFAQQQILADKDMVAHIKKGMDHTYNFEFEKARLEYAPLQQKYPTHPVYHFLMGLNSYWEIIFQENFSQGATVLKSHLNKALELSNAIVQKYPNDPEGVFFKLSSEAYFVLFYAEMNDNSAAFSVARKAYYTLKKGRELKSKLNEFYFPSGMYDYFIVQYPENKPAFKAFTVFFMSGDKARGLKDLDYTFHNAIFTRMECGYHLSNIYLKYEDKPVQAYPYTSLLVEKYPQNLYFRIKHAEACMAKGLWDEARNQLPVIRKSSKPFFQGTASVLEGLIAEKGTKDLVQAEKKYQESIQFFKKSGNPENDFLAFAYAGMARVNVHKKNKAEADRWYKVTQAIAEYTSLIQECKRYFKTN
ncbi:MAG: hypothetical protein MUF42_01850 [Cytophagaceae bacterium]|jgi:tetratricopeptide (TPR) repeat protein|nr:hypothetical protein [Cytophagaceae bacterium]